MMSELERHIWIAAYAGAFSQSYDDSKSDSEAGWRARCSADNAVRCFRAHQAKDPTASIDLK